MLSLLNYHHHHLFCTHTSTHMHLVVRRCKQSAFAFAIHPREWCALNITHQTAHSACKWVARAALVKRQSEALWRDRLSYTDAQCSHSRAGQVYEWTYGWMAYWLPEVLIVNQVVAVVACGTCATTHTITNTNHQQIRFNWFTNMNNVFDQTWIHNYIHCININW